MESEEFVKLVLPSLIKLFASTERAVRIALLQNVGSYAQHLSNSLVADTLWPQVAMGFADVNPILREITLTSVPHFVPKLSTKIIDTQVPLFFSLTITCFVS
jgi:SCY1-like protein 1